ncbi:MAG: DinB family protein [Gemmatimonadota bacterium]
MQRVWFERAFELGLPRSHALEIVERLRGTPARLEERLHGVGRDILLRRPAVDGSASWSIQEHVGHLVDLEALWLARVDDLAEGADVLTEADLENRATWDAGHNERPLDDVLASFRSHRATLVSRLESLGDDGWSSTSLHPRLRQPMSAVDLAFFVAEHDDHHLATIGLLLA